MPGLKDREIPYYGVKEAVFPFSMFPEVDPVLGPEMRSTGEVLGLAETTGEAFFKAEEGAKATLPMEGTVLISLNTDDKPEAVPLARKFREAGFSILATGRTAEKIAAAGIPVEKVLKNYEGRPNVADFITNGRIQLIVNTPQTKQSHHDDSYLRKAAIKARTVYITTVAAAKAAAEGIHYIKNHDDGAIHSLQEWHAMISDK